MRIAIYGKNISEECQPSIIQLISRLRTHQCAIIIYKPFLDYLLHEKHLAVKSDETFLTVQDMALAKPDFVMSIGGDGTFLETVSFVRDCGFPIVGMNTGRLGFLSNISKDEIPEAVESILSGQFTIEERQLIRLVGPEAGKFAFPLALNEFVVQKSGLSMVTVHAWVNGELVNSYLADGLIISTPTGSTAYSMSAGGPIVMPSAGCFIIAPIAPHNLTMRPIIIPDSSEIKLRTESRNPKLLASLDYQSIELPAFSEIILRKADFSVRTVRLRNLTYFDTLRNKLMWGADRRT